MNKKIFILILIFALLSSTVISYANDNINLEINGEQLVLDQNPVNINGRILAPVSAIFKALDMTVEWNGTTKTIKAYDDLNLIILTLNKNTAVVNGNDVNLDVPAQAINGRTMVPVSFIVTNLGYDVKWDSISRTVKIIVDHSAKLEKELHTKFIPNHDAKLMYLDDLFVEQMKLKYHVDNIFGNYVDNTDTSLKYKFNIFSELTYTINSEKKTFKNSIELYNISDSKPLFLAELAYSDTNKINISLRGYDEMQFEFLKDALGYFIGSETAGLFVNDYKTLFNSYYDFDNKAFKPTISELKNKVVYYQGYKVSLNVTYSKINGEMTLILGGFDIE